MTETHQNKAQKVKITTQKASERVGAVLNGQKSENQRKNKVLATQIYIYDFNSPK